MQGIPLDNGVESPGGRSSAMPDVGTGTPGITITVAGVVCAPFPVRARGVAPFATPLAPGHGAWPIGRRDGSAAGVPG